VFKLIFDGEPHVLIPFRIIIAISIIIVTLLFITVIYEFIFLRNKLIIFFRVVVLNLAGWHLDLLNLGIGIPSRGITGLDITLEAGLLRIFCQWVHMLVVQKLFCLDLFHH
jgi:hypothetical protein